MILRTPLLEAAQRLIFMFGPARSRRVCAEWRDAMTPALIADLWVLADMDAPSTRADGTALDADTRAIRDGKRELALAIFARAEITDRDIDKAMMELRHEAVVDDGADLGWDGDGAF